MEELFELKNYFYLGNYPAALQEGATLAVDDAGAAIERDVVIARVEIAMGNLDKVIASVSDSSPQAMQAARAYAMYLKDPSEKAMVMETIKVWLEDPVCNTNPSLLLFAALIYVEEEEYDQALRVANKGKTLEHSALKVRILMTIDRLDQAKKELEAMKRVDEYATLTQLCTGWVNLAVGGESVQEALYAYQELLERHGSTEPLLNGVALSKLIMGRYEEAERTLQEALGKNPNYADTLVNSIVCATFKKKPAELVARYDTQLHTVAPKGHPWVSAEDAFKTMFDDAKSAVGSS